MSYGRSTLPDGPLLDVELQTPTDYAAVLAVELCLFDGLMTLPFWHLEANPFVLSLGASGMLLVKLVGTVGLVWLWFHHREARPSRVAKGCVWFLCGLYAVVIVTNSVVLFGGL